jgi:protein-tyrosine phosphatase
MILDCNEIIPARLWVGAYLMPDDLKALARMFISAVVSLQSEEDLQAYGIPLKRLFKAYADAGIEFRSVPTPDFNKEALAANLPLCVAEVAAALRPVSARVYLHCTAGINRAPTTAAAYLIWWRKLSAQDAHDYLVTRRHCSPSLDILENYACSLDAER